MQYEQFAGGAREPLPRPSIDTGMGLERFATVMQGVHDVFDTDLFRRIYRGVRRTDGAAVRRRACRKPSRHRRSSALVRVPDRRRRAAVQ